jgi:hypothetical protein
MQQKRPLQPLPEEKASRVWIEDIRPQIDCGRFPIKRTVGEKVKVSAFVFADGHDDVKAVLCYRQTNGKWNERPIVTSDILSSQNKDFFLSQNHHSISSHLIFTSLSFPSSIFHN